MVLGFKVPVMLWIFRVSIASSMVSGGSMVGRRLMSMDFPEPGGPIRSMLWRPVAAMVRARLARAWPLMSAKSSWGSFGRAFSPLFPWVDCSV